MTGSDLILERMLALHPLKIDLSLGRLEALLARMGDPHLHLPPVIHVAGTNGKGSTVAFMRAVLEAAGRKVHVYTSPHLVRFHERIRLAGQLVDEARLTAALQECERVNAGAPITLFEMTTAVAFKLFHETPADVLLLEVGLGGRFDATNVIAHPALCVITPVSIDHPEFLGATLAQIAFEKAGIIKPRVPVVVAAQEDEARAVIERQAEKLHAPFLIGAQDFTAREERGRLVYQDETGLLDLPLPRLAGRHQIQNAGTAIAALRQFDPLLADAAFEAGMVRVDWPARLQRLTPGPLLALAPDGAELWLDGGHNVAGGRVLGEAMADLEARMPRPLVIICGTLATKDTAGFLSAFRGLARQVIAVPIPGEHAGRAPQEVAAAAAKAGLRADCASSVAEALELIAAASWDEPPRILIAGSLYLAGKVLEANGALPV
jgi:dihydrofolate synthase/folylpolyglutamate synthase